MSLCESIDTLAMAYLDDELANEERRELDTHLTECASCRAEIDGARADQSLIQGRWSRRALPTRCGCAWCVRSMSRIARPRRKRRDPTQAVVVVRAAGYAMLAAAAAILVFVGVNMKSNTMSASSVRSRARACGSRAARCRSRSKARAPAHGSAICRGRAAAHQQRAVSCSARACCPAASAATTARC